MRAEISVNVSAGIDFLSRTNEFTLQPFPTVAHVSDDFAGMIIIFSNHNRAI